LIAELLSENRDVLSSFREKDTAGETGNARTDDRDLLHR
jgi:hypothetical protein